MSSSGQLIASLKKYAREKAKEIRRLGESDLTAESAELTVAGRSWASSSMSSGAPLGNSMSS